MSIERAGSARSRRPSVAYATAIVCAFACAQARAQRVSVTDRDGGVAVVDGLRFDEDRLRGQVRGQSWSLPLRDLWFAAPERASAARAAPDAAFVLLRKGPRVAGRVASASRDAESGRTELQFEPRSGERSALPMRHVQAIRFAEKAFVRRAPQPVDAGGPKAKKPQPGAQAQPAGTSAKKKPEGPADEGFELACAQPPKNNDLLFVRVGERLRRVPCRVQGIEDGKVVANRGAVELSKVYGVVFGEISGVEAERLPSERRVRVEHADGSTLEGTLRAIDGKRVAFELDAGVRLHAEWRDLRDVELLSERLVYLSSLELQRESRAPAALLREWPLLRDRGPGGAALQLGARRYRRGFFVVPPRKMVFELPRKFDRLEGEVGMLPSRFGGAKLRFWVGDRPLGDAIELRPGDPARSLRFELGGATRVTVELDVGPDLDSGARVVLGDLRVIAE